MKILILIVLLALNSNCPQSFNDKQISKCYYSPDGKADLCYTQDGEQCYYSYGQLSL